MFGKSKDNADEKARVPAPVQQFQRLAVAHSAAPELSTEISSICSGMTIVGKMSGDGTVKVFGRIEGELRASTIVIAEGAEVEGDLAAEDLTIGGRVKGTVHAGRVKLASTAVVDGDIFHRSLAIEENARFEGSSRREDDVIDTPRVPLGRASTQAQTNLAATESNRKLNGAPDKDGHAGPPTD